MIGQSAPRVDAYDKVTGRAKYTQDLCPRNALVARVVHSQIAHGNITNMDITKALAVPGVIKIATCLDVPDHPFPTAGHVWSTDKAHQDIADRQLLNRHVRYYGDDIAVVIAMDDVAAARAAKLIEVTYDTYPAYLSIDSHVAGGQLIHDAYPDNVLKTTSYALGDYDAAIADDTLCVFDDTFETPIIQHCHIESVTSFAYMEGDRVVVVAATQIPHIARRVIGQALGIPWGQVRVIKPTLGGGFGNRQDVLYEPLNAWLTTLVGGRPVKLELSREEVFESTRTRHAIRFQMRTHVRKDGRFVARRIWATANNGAYASHGHAIVANAITAFRQIYNDEQATVGQATTIYTNLPTAGAMRGYGIPQVNAALEAHVDNIAHALQLDPVEIRRMNMMKQGFVDPLNKITTTYNGLEDALDKGYQVIGWSQKREAYRQQTGAVRRGVGVSIFCYKTGVYPISLETGACRLSLNQDGSVQVQLGATEIGQGMDTVACQMVAQTLSIPLHLVHIVSTQDTDVTPFDTGAYASRQSYVSGQAIKRAASALKETILDRAASLFSLDRNSLTLVNAAIVSGTDIVKTLPELALESIYSLHNAKHLTAEVSHDCKSNAFAFGACFAEVEVDMALDKIKVLQIVNIHDSGTILNPQLAEAQVHGGMSMSLGYGLSEQLLIDPKTGRVLNGNLLDYKLPTSMDTPELQVFFVGEAEETGPYGNKALGEPPAIPSASAVRNAVLHATGVALQTMPMTPQRLFEAFGEVTANV